MLDDVLTYNLPVVFCGTAKGKASARKGYYYAGPGNKFYSILHKASFTPFKLEPLNCYEINKYGIGLTDLVHTECGNDNELQQESYEVELFINKMKEFKPLFVAFTSKAAASFALGYEGKTGMLNYGLQVSKIGSSKVFVLPSTSGSARRYWDEQWWFKLKELISYAK